MLATHTHDMSQQLGFTPPYDALLDMHLGSSYATDSNTDMNEAQHGGTQAQEQCATTTSHPDRKQQLSDATCPV